MVQVSTDWQLDVSRGPGCVIVRPHHLDRKLGKDITVSDVSSLAEDIWAILDKHLTYRVVLEMDDIVQLTSLLLGQLVALQARVDTHGGTVHVCGLSPSNENVLEITHLRGRIPCYGTRGEAVHGSMNRPVQPR